ncbi:sensor domain-containing protein [Xanthomonas hyacinthi]|uniref:sensor domain-containing protein n=1 Tax=Xanthomonas hyacinthi TaxID=56455 RepID=UPI001FCC4B5E|nr:sensor domain-containing protein [Xanthomonas hyacinthi]
MEDGSRFLPSHRRCANANAAQRAQRAAGRPALPGPPPPRAAQSHAAAAAARPSARWRSAGPPPWTTMLYFVLMLPLGIVYFGVFVARLSTALALPAAPPGLLFPNEIHVGLKFGDLRFGDSGLWLLPLVGALGSVLLFATLHLARAVGKLHGMLAKHLLVHSAAQ